MLWLPPLFLRRSAHTPWSLPPLCRAMGTFFFNPACPYFSFKTFCLCDITSSSTLPVPSRTRKTLSVNSPAWNLVHQQLHGAGKVPPGSWNRLRDLTRGAASWASLAWRSVEHTHEKSTFRQFCCQFFNKFLLNVCKRQALGPCNLARFSKL